jgi:FixJ family two-component response regulator
MNHTIPSIAIVDDDESVCRAMKRLVRSFHMQAETYTSGRQFLQAIEAVPSLRPDCVILDLHMPGMNGLELQTHLAGTGTPIIFMTGHDEPKARAEALAAGAVAFLRKPFEDDLLARTLRVALERAETGRRQTNGEE